MYGLVNKAIKDLVVENHGQEKWQEILLLATVKRGYGIFKKEY